MRPFVRPTLLLLSLLACRGAGVVDVQGELEVTPAELSFGSAFLGQTTSQRLGLNNRGRGDLTVALQVDPPFEVEVSSVTVPGGARREVAVSFRPTVRGAHAALLHVEDVDVPLSGEGLEPLECPPPEGGCRTTRFDPAQGRCVTEDVPDGAACASACLTAGQCRAGACVGQALDCDDQNACTRDWCAEGEGCRHDDTTAECPAGLLCQKAVCDPQRGCGLADEPDGTSCGASDCSVSNVCMTGHCRQLPTPSGGACGEASTCQGRGRCQGTTCVMPPPSAPQVSWRYAATVGDGVEFYGGLVSPQGDVYFLEYEKDSIGDIVYDSAQMVSLSRDGALRFRAATGWVTPVLDAAHDRFFHRSQGRLYARSTRDGRVLWEADLTVGVPVHDTSGGASGRFWLEQPVVLTDGTVVLNLSEGSSSHWSHLTAVDGATGAIRWRHSMKGHLYGLGAGRNGTLWLSSADCWAPAGQVTRLDKDGATLASAFVTGLLVGYADQTALFNPSRRLESITPTLSTVPFSLGGDMPAGNPLWTPGQVVTLGDSGNIFSLDDQTGAQRWRAVPRFRPMQLALAANGGALAAGTTNLIGLDANGAEALTCSFPSPIRGDLPVVLGRLYAQVGPELVVYELPSAWNAPAQGWVGAAGGPSRDRRAH